MHLAPLKVLSENDLDAIHEASLRVLADAGVAIHSPRVLGMLADAGVAVDMETRMAKLSTDVVERCLQTTPKDLTLCDRLGRPALPLNSGRSFAASGHNAIYVLEPEGVRRPARKRDVAEFARLSDALTNISAVGVQAMPQDVHPAASLLHGVEACFCSTTKHLYFSPDSAGVTASLIEMVRVIAGTENLSEKPIATCQLSSTSPLYWESGAVESLLQVARSGMPCCLLPQPYSGVTSPITLAGTLVVHNAEALSGIVISQIARPGAPVIYGSAWTTFDMREGNVTIGSPEAVLLRIAGAQLAGYYGLPSHTIGPDTDAHCLDEQTGWEKALTLAGAVAAGVDLIVNAGMLATGLTVSFEQLVMDDEMIGMAARMREGISVSDSTLAARLIGEVGPAGSFVTCEHTLGNLRSGEHWLPLVSNRQVYDRWIGRGAVDIAASARAEAARILAEHIPDPLDDAEALELRRIVESFEAGGYQE